MTLFRRILWIGVALGGAFALGGVALHRGESINALWIVAAAVYRRLGLRWLRRGWVNLDAVWAGALVVTAALTAL